MSIILCKFLCSRIMKQNSLPTGVVERYDKIHPSNLEWNMGQHVAFGRSCGTVAGRHTSNNGNNMLVCVLLLFQSNAISCQIRKVFIFFFSVLFMSNKKQRSFVVLCSWGFNQKYCELGLLVALGRNDILDVAKNVHIFLKICGFCLAGRTRCYNIEQDRSLWKVVVLFARGSDMKEFALFPEDRYNYYISNNHSSGDFNHRNYYTKN